MKMNFVKYFLSLFLISIFGGCEDGPTGLTRSEEMIYRQIAFKSLTDQEKNSLTINWEEAPVKRGVYIKSGTSHIFKEIDTENEHPFYPGNDDIKLKSRQLLIRVLFTTDVDPLLGPIILILDPLSLMVVGFLPRF